MSAVRTRFAPSPTGFLHLGSARTALFNWAFARHHGGEFVLRVEDTDRQRSTAESEAQLIEGLQWLGLDWDEGPIRQSERRARHDEAVEQLLERGAAYRCRATVPQIEAEREKALAAGNKNFVFQSPDRDADLGPDCGPHAVRLKVPREGFLGWDDLVFGESGQAAAEIGDLVIRRTDGSPLFYLTGAVDDLDMGITHVIRGADHHSNTPFQIALYRALGAEPPRFAHVPLIVGEGGKKLSKRRDPVSIQQFRADGYLAAALTNWLVRLGWSHGDEEIFSHADIVKHFSLEAVGRAPARADLSKLQWLDQHYIKEMPADALFEAVRPFVEEMVGRAVERTPAVDKILDLLRERSKTLAEMADLGRWMWLEPETIEPKAAKHLKPAAAPILRDLVHELGALETWNDAAIERVFESVRARHGDIGMGKLAQPVRAAVTGRSFSPGIYETLEGIGREPSLARLQRALDGLEA
ncbi:MAG: glutamate--tRNA ligase [Myxococcota bacterium]